MEKNDIVYFIIFITIYDAIKNGWKIKKISNNKYIFSKKIIDIKKNDLNYIRNLILV